MAKRYQLDGYQPHKGRMTEKIEECLSNTDALSAQEISDLSGVPMPRVRDHLNYHTRTGRLKKVDDRDA